MRNRGEREREREGEGKGGGGGGRDKATSPSYPSSHDSLHPSASLHVPSCSLTMISSLENMAKCLIS